MFGLLIHAYCGNAHLVNIIFESVIHDSTASWVAALGVLLLVLGYTNHLWYTDRIETAECLSHVSMRAESGRMCYTDLGESTLWELSIPLVCHLFDLALRVVLDGDDRVDGLLRTSALDLVPRGEVHLDGVAAASDLVAEALNLAECALEAVLKQCQSCMQSHGTIKLLTHCASYCLRPLAMVRGSVKTPSSFHS